jgi:hypothetical protein
VLASNPRMATLQRVRREERNWFDLGWANRQNNPVYSDVPDHREIPYFAARNHQTSQPSNAE